MKSERVKAKTGRYIYIGSQDTNVQVNIKAGQVWRAKHLGSYWWLTREGASGVKIRMTDKKFLELFDIIEEENNGSKRLPALSGLP